MRARLFVLSVGGLVWRFYCFCFHHSKKIKRLFNGVHMYMFVLCIVYVVRREM